MIRQSDLHRFDNPKSDNKKSSRSMVGEDGLTYWQRRWRRLREIPGFKKYINQRNSEYRQRQRETNKEEFDNRNRASAIKSYWKHRDKNLQRQLAYRKDNREKERKRAIIYNRKRREIPELVERNRIHSAKWRKENPEKSRLSCQKSYRKRKSKIRQFRREHPEIRIAYGSVFYCSKAGVIKKPDKCENIHSIDCSNRLHAHHEDYSRPLDVVWLCTNCHRRLTAWKVGQQSKGQNSSIRVWYDILKVINT